MKFFIYRLDWNDDDQKYKKKPCRLDGANFGEGESHKQPAFHGDRQTVERYLAGLPRSGRSCYALGMYAESGDNLFILDLDGVVDGTGQLDAVASTVVHPFLAAGAYFEGSSSGRGCHIIGRYTGSLPPHANKRPSVHTYEFYSPDVGQGVALNSTHSTGSWDVECTAIVHALLRDYFPPRAQNARYEYKEAGPRDDWDGPTDDDELIRRALAARGSAAAAFGGRATFAQLWAGQVEKNSESDLALASHLAFWTGCDVPRIERLMRRSGLYRAKWDEHRTYLKELTIELACGTTENVYKQQRIKLPAALTDIAKGDTDWYAVVDKVTNSINECGDLKSLLETVMPSIPAMRIPSLYSERIVQALSKRLALFDNKISLPKLRQLVAPAVEQVENNVVVPDWCAPMCYVKTGDKFLNTANGSIMSVDGFRMSFTRFMPFKNNGDREDPVKFARDRWNVPVVDDVLYRPDRETFFQEGSKTYGNLFLPGSMPEPVQPSPTCAQAIQMFQQHLYLMAGQRADVYSYLLLWIAFAVQRPGRKIRWSPLIKGVQGDGKTIVGDLLLACLTLSNMKMTSNSSLTNSGGFTDWATGKAVNVIEEIRLVGREKHRLYNAMKIFIGDTLIDLNRKGRASGDSLVNVTNHWANTNYKDALPTDNRERRWMIVFSPYGSIEDAVRAKGLARVEDLVAQFKFMGSSMRLEPGAWRAWLLGIDTSAFDPDGRAPMTDEREKMAAMAEDPVESVIKDVIEQGAPGVTKDVFSSSMLRRALKVRATIEDLQIPGTIAWHSTLADLGYSPYPKVTKIRGAAHRLWVRDDFHGEKDEIIGKLENSFGAL